MVPFIVAAFRSLSIVLYEWQTVSIIFIHIKNEEWTNEHD